MWRGACAQRGTGGFNWVEVERSSLKNIGVWCVEVHAANTKDQLLVGNTGPCAHGRGKDGS